MGYTYYDIAHAWAHDLNSCHGYCSQNMSHGQGKLYSYSTVIGQKIDRDGRSPLWLVQNASYSASTGKHQGYMRNAKYGGPTVDVSKYGFKYGWNGVSDYNGLNQGLESLCRLFIEEFYVLLAQIPNSKSIKSEEISSPTYEINILIDATGCTSWKKLAAHKWQSYSIDKKKASELRKLTIALSHGNLSIPELVVAVFGEKAWNKHITLTLPQQKARETRRAKEWPGYVPVDFTKVTVFDFQAELKAAKARERRENARKIKELRAKKDKWLRGDAHYISSYDFPNNMMTEIFGGGNVLLRIYNGQVETSKGIFIAFDECERLWKLISAWHNKRIEFHKDVCHATSHKWVIESFKDDILTSGCHSIAYSEMERIAKELKFANAV